MPLLKKTAVFLFLSTQWKKKRALLFAAAPGYAGLTIYWLVVIGVIVMSGYLVGGLIPKRFPKTVGTKVVTITPPKFRDKFAALQLRTFTGKVIETTVAPVSTSQPTQPPPVTDAPQPTTPPQETPVPTGKDTLPPSGLFFCLDDEGGKLGNEVCDDSTKNNIKVGSGGVGGSCGTVIRWSQEIMKYLTGKKYNALSRDLVNCNYTANKTSSYTSTYNVIDSYNLAGVKGLTKASHTSGQAMEAYFRSASGYKFIPYNGSLQSIAGTIQPGWVVFMSSGYVAVVNSVEIDGRGNGWISHLQVGAPYWLGGINMAGWKAQSTTTKHSVVGFGGR
jgi:hypothetical protein